MISVLEEHVCKAYGPLIIFMQNEGWESRDISKTNISNNATVYHTW